MFGHTTVLASVVEKETMSENEGLTLSSVVVAWEDQIYVVGAFCTIETPLIK